MAIEGESTIPKLGQVSDIATLTSPAENPNSNEKGFRPSRLTSHAAAMYPPNRFPRRRESRIIPDGGG